MTNLMAALVTDEACWNLADQNLTIHGADETEKILLDDAAAAVDTLSERFGINAADVGGRGLLEERVEQSLRQAR